MSDEEEPFLPQTPVKWVAFVVQLIGVIMMLAVIVLSFRWHILITISWCLISTIVFGIGLSIDPDFDYEEDW